MNAIELSLFSSRINAICEEMGAYLQAAAFSPNIRDRLDYSCAIFDAKGRLCAQAAHIPVHLGSMAYALEKLVTRIQWEPGQLLLFNDPYAGGTHLPDLTLVSPVYVDDEMMGFVANRAHHADVGADKPGSMPISRNIKEEGLLIGPTQVGAHGQLDKTITAGIFANMQNPALSLADLAAQAGANGSAVKRLSALIETLRKEDFTRQIEALHVYGERLMKSLLSSIPKGKYYARDYLDDDGQKQQDLKIEVCICIDSNRAIIDFEGTQGQVSGNVNCPISVTASAVYYVFRCLFSGVPPLCAGTFRPLQILAPSGSLLNARYPAAVAAGNVETSSRIVDVLFAALAKALPEKIPACSQGTMNNLAMGQNGENPWSYYETIGGGAGASAKTPGASGIQSHMTNTRNTPIEVLEMHFPLRVRKYALRDQSGGIGRLQGGLGIIREYEFLRDGIEFTILSERRRHAPAGLLGGKDALRGRNLFNQNELPGKVSAIANRGDVLAIETPGGGGYGAKK